LGLDENDELIGVARTKAGDPRYPQYPGRYGNQVRRKAVRSMGRPAYGVKGIELTEGAEVIGMVVANGDDRPGEPFDRLCQGLWEADTINRVPDTESRRVRA